MKDFKRIDQALAPFLPLFNGRPLDGSLHAADRVVQARTNRGASLSDQQSANRQNVRDVRKHKLCLDVTG